MDLNKQWWVSGMRYELMKPFYELKVQPTLPEDSGNYRCRLEADPLFAQDIMSHVTPLIVMVKPPSPSKPQITSYSERNVTLTWTHTIAKAHLPILKYSILISQLEADNIEVILTRNNISTITINNLKPYTRYAFSVRAENAAGHSNFGQEIVFRTMGEAPKIAPKIVSIVNGSDRCVDVKWENQNKSNLEVSGYRIMVHRLGSGDMREWYFKTTSNSLCSLGYHQDYRLSIEADNGFGYSPSVTQIFKTDIGVPTSPPQITSILSSTSTSVAFAWKEPKEPNGPINYFYVYYYPIKNPSQITKLQLKFNHEDHAKGYVHNITKLSSNTAYKIEMTAQTEKDEKYGESIASGMFEKYCKSLQANDNALYTEQFEELSKESEKMEVEGTSNSCEDFQQKNRYLNIGAYEGTRIKLSGNNTSDYINANYIDSCENKKAYIATQAPLPNTFGDFWSMIWQEKCNAIVCITKMVEKGRRKCDQYWPSDKKIPEVINGFTLTLTSEISNAYFVHRIITLKSSKCMLPERTVHHVQFTAWPDHGVPDNVFPLLSFMNYVTALESNGPLIVHCSAGVGRSGSYILIDSIRKHLSKSDYVKIQAHLRHMRKQRGKLVQTLEQYIFCHEVIKQLIKNGNTRMPTKQIMNYVQYLVESKDQGRSGIQAQYEDVCKLFIMAEAIFDEEEHEFYLSPKHAEYPANEGGASRHLMVNSSQDRIVIKIKCSNNAVYRISPVYTALEPGEAQRLQIVRDPGESRIDKMVVQYMFSKVKSPHEAFLSANPEIIKRMMIVLIAHNKHPQFSQPRIAPPGVMVNSGTSQSNVFGVQMNSRAGANSYMAGGNAPKGIYRQGTKKNIKSSKRL
uniref:Protein-tyrosine-phosphatase n=1 Tax=Rhabditophanes sp. KR3021 TaxID=114890 RepID=A0AC35U6U5_9BILA